MTVKVPGKAPKSRGTSNDVMRRKLHIYLYLQHGAKTINAIKAYLEQQELPKVDRRTLQRNLREMEDSFGIYQVNDDAGKGQACLWAVNNKMFQNPFAFSPDLAMALALTYQQVKTSVPADIVEKVEPAFKQAMAQLEKSESIQAKWAQRVHVSASSYVLPAAKVKPEIAKRLTDCALNQVAVQIIYRITHTAKDSTIQGTALGIHYRGNIAYLILRPRGKKRVRQLPFSRIYAVKELITTLPEVGDFMIDAFAKQGKLTMTYGEPFRLEAVIFESVRREIEDAPLGDDQVLMQAYEDDMYRKLSVTVPYNLDLVQWLLARAPYLKVLGPEPFKVKFEEELHRAWRNVLSGTLDVPKEKNFEVLAN
ncbi:WYL domain-containing protein [Alkalimonas sp. MEB108]|uniref:WYL domain-containing protein n=1 Tax=Alkalimonas cellulosilytica TaxID=3058395 RepID=A0ABU7J9D0_9GAMM|nr:WYL domain-containing protein [Alkalimonas sp. MEB108]MEE2003163.1 WYL domain-containing protein [Alkalimonas sp. MEB108]